MSESKITWADALKQEIIDFTEEHGKIYCDDVIKLIDTVKPTEK